MDISTRRFDRDNAGSVNWKDQVFCGDAGEVLDRLPEACVDTVITSPPYYQQRDYEHPQQIGREGSLDSYLSNLRRVFRSARRVVKPTGVIWVVIGDKYRQGELLGAPWRLAFGLVDDGWHLRSDVIWHKPNAMPSSAKTRPTTDHEYVFFLSRGKAYYYDADAIREPHVTFSKQSRMKGGRNHFGKRGGTPERGKNRGQVNLHDARWDQAFHPKGRNKRTVWSIPLSKFREAHFAVFPPQLIETCIAATCPPEGVVLDPFSGSGTTAVVAAQLERHFIAIDCVEAYCEMTRQRLAASRDKRPAASRRNHETPSPTQKSLLDDQ